MQTPTTPVMMENPDDMRRISHVFERGNWLVKGEVVTPGTPHSLNPMPANAPKNRLGLAMWLTSKQNPLTARTMVNRLWEQLFGTGLVETLEDLGTQGIPPTHKELLDYLSYKFMNDYNWDVKRLLKEIVMSATYQQDSKVSTRSSWKKISPINIMQGDQGCAYLRNKYATRRYAIQWFAERKNVWPKCNALPTGRHLAFAVRWPQMGNEQGRRSNTGGHYILTGNERRLILP